jgi:2'-5' RNA ligase
MTAVSLPHRLRDTLGRAQVRLRPASALIVPVLDAEPAVAAWLGQRTVDFDGAPLHVTVMFPFLPGRRLAEHEDDIMAFAAGIEPFSFTLARLGGFPGVHYLAPEPADAFVDIVERVMARWPGYRPYGGVFDAIVPHVTVAFGDQPPADPASLAAKLPITTTARELWLLRQTVRGWRTRARFPLGGG